MSPMLRRNKPALLLAVILSFSLLALDLFRRAFLWGAVTEGKFFLAQNLPDYLNGATNFTSQEDGQIFLYPRQVDINGTNYTCALALDRPKFKGNGILAITTNRFFIWIDKSGRAQLR
ncbi:MAG: hypothetical protein ACXW3Z_12175 [Limisphaerales bacterium]